MTLAPVDIDQDAILRTLKLDPRSPDTQALLLICERYGLDPLLKHVVLIQGRPYVTRDGYLHVAHHSGQFDGIEIKDEGVHREASEKGYWWAIASVYRKDMSHPFTYRGRYPLKGGNSAYGPEMAIKCAEVMALRRAFNVTGVGAAEERGIDATEESISPQIADDLATRLNVLGKDARAAFLDHFARTPRQLAATDEAAAIEFVENLELEAPFDDEISPVGDDDVTGEAEPAGAQDEGKML